MRNNADHLSFYDAAAWLRGRSGYVGVGSRPSSQQCQDLLDDSLLYAGENGDMTGTHFGLDKVTDASVDARNGQPELA